MLFRILLQEWLIDHWGEEEYKKRSWLLFAITLTVLLLIIIAIVT